MTKPTCRREPSRPSTLPLVVVFRIELDLSEKIEDARLFAPLDVLFKRFGHGRLFCSMATNLLRFVEESIINRQVRTHAPSFTQRGVWRKVQEPPNRSWAHAGNLTKITHVVRAVLNASVPHSHVAMPSSMRYRPQLIGSPKRKPSTLVVHVLKTAQTWQPSK